MALSAFLVCVPLHCRRPGSRLNTFSLPLSGVLVFWHILVPYFACYSTWEHVSSFHFFGYRSLFDLYYFLWLYFFGGTICASLQSFGHFLVLIRLCFVLEFISKYDLFHICFSCLLMCYTVFCHSALISFQVYRKSKLDSFFCCSVLLFATLSFSILQDSLNSLIVCVTDLSWAFSSGNLVCRMLVVGGPQEDFFIISNPSSKLTPDLQSFANCRSIKTKFVKICKLSFHKVKFAKFCKLMLSLQKFANNGPSSFRSRSA